MAKTKKEYALYEYDWCFNDDAEAEAWEDMKSNITQGGETIIYEDKELFITSAGKKHTMQECRDMLSEDDWLCYKDTLHDIKDACEKSGKFAYYIASGSVQTWQGTRNAYKILDDLSQLQSLFSGYDIRLYVRGNKIIAMLSHHDGTHILEIKGVPKKYPYKSKAQGIGKIVRNYIGA
jgi:hypothetical protein